MSIMGTVKKGMKQASKIIIVPKTRKEKLVEPPNFIHETPEEYANRLTQRRNRRY